MANATAKYRFVGDHAEHLSDGTALEPGEFYDITISDLDDYHNKDLLETGKLLRLEEPAPAEKKKEA